jgi:hypothetical protein
MASRVWLEAVVVALGAAAMGCSSGSGLLKDGGGGSSPDAAATGGASGHDAGTSGAPGHDAGASGGGAGADAAPDHVTSIHDAAVDTGAADGPPLGACLGVCLETFLFDCQKSVGCTTTTSGADTFICYSNGVKEKKTNGPTAIEGTVKNANGDVCYSYTRTATVQAYMDLGGHTVAELDEGATDLLYTVMCGSEPPHEIYLGAPACAERQAISFQTCTPGACSF